MAEYKTINEITNVSTQANDDDLLIMWDKNREKTVKIKNKDFNKNNQPKTLETPIEVDNVEETTVEGALGAINDKVKNFTAGVAFKGTRSAYETAKLIPEGSDGHIPSGALVIITDEGRTYVTNGTGSGQTLELVANATFNGSHAQWNALTLTQKAMYSIVNFTDDSPSSYEDIYSTNEVKTNKVWIDGKPIYRKVIDIGNLPNATTKFISHNITNLGKVIRLYGFANDSTNTDHITLPFVDNNNSATYNTSLRALASHIVLSTLGELQGFSGYAVIEYTKTTA